MILIDGSFGEGGGQILRTSLALSLVKGKPFQIKNIRANRKKPGLMHQHLTSVNAAAEISEAEIRGNALGSCNLYFAPKAVKPGNYHFSVGTAGSCTLVLQTILPALLMTDDKSEITLEGGTHNPFAPPFDFLSKAFLPVINSMGHEVNICLHQHGFYPAGGGRITATIVPRSQAGTWERKKQEEAPGWKQERKINLTQRGKIKHRKIRAIVARLSEEIAEREIRQIKKRKPDWDKRFMSVETISNSKGPGNVIIAEIESEHITEVFTSFGKRGVRAEQVADRILKDIETYSDADVPVGKHLADQLLIPLVLSGGGKIRTLTPTQHTTTNIEIIRQFVDVDIILNCLEDGRWEIGY